MHRFIVKKNENGLFDINAVSFSDMIYSKFDIQKTDVKKEMIYIEYLISLNYEEKDKDLAQVKFEFID